MSRWHLTSANPAITLQVDAGDQGPMKGWLTVGPNTCAVTGSWAASNSVPGRNASAFSLTGSTGDPAPIFISASGIMTGPGNNPSQVTLRVLTSSSADGSLAAYEAVLLPAQPLNSPWLLNFTSSDPSLATGDGRPWGDGTAMARRAYAGVAPWDIGNTVTPMVGGDVTMDAMREAFEEAIADATSSSKPPGQRGHVYIAGWQFNALRDLSANTQPWTDAAPGSKAQTALGLVCRMMAAGINVRLLLWMPTTNQWTFGPSSLADEHWAVASAVQDYEATMEKRFSVTEPLGVVALDLRTATALSASLHQKMIAVRVGAVNVAFCGGVDLAFTRRDHGLTGTEPIGAGDWQSGDTSPLPSWWSQMEGGDDYPPYPDPHSKLAGHFSEDLPANVYGTALPQWRHWHDHHLKLEGPIVATLEQQFAERWVMDTGGRVYTFDRKSSIGYDNQVQLTSAKAWTGGKVRPLPPATPVSPTTGSAVVQMWRTIPLRASVSVGPLLRGEFTVGAGVANAIKQSSSLITVWDQYFWSEPVARQLGFQLMANPNLLLLVVVPPFGTTDPSNELWYRRRALLTLQSMLDQPARGRVRVKNMWSSALNEGVYVHAKVQTYDESLLVCGSANLNRRSTQCDAELDCAVLDRDVVRTHLSNLYACLAGKPWRDFGPGWLAEYWHAMDADTAATLIADPFWAGVSNPKTPNGVPMPTNGMKPEHEFEPSSVYSPLIGDGLEQSTCQYTSTGTDPKSAGRLDEVSFLMERCTASASPGWPWRQPSGRP